MGAGRPPKNNELKKALGSKHYKPDVLDGVRLVPPLLTPEIPPPSLNEDAQRQWIISVPSLANMGRVFEHHRTLLCILCSELACYYKETEPRERRVPLMLVRVPRRVREGAKSDKTVLEFSAVGHFLIP